jgi:hypothetical protein
MKYCSKAMGTGIAQWYSTGIGAGWAEVRVPRGAGNFSLHRRVQTGCGVHTIYYPGAPFLEAKRTGREADHSHPSSSEVKNAWSYTSTPQYVFMAWCSGIEPRSSDRPARSQSLSEVRNNANELRAGLELVTLVSEWSTLPGHCVRICF